MKTIVVAYDKNYGIGAKNDLLWQRDLPNDLKHFREVTTGGAIIMGRNTFESIGRALPNRQNIVITRQSHTPVENVEFVRSLDEAYAVVEPGRETYIIGGGQIYALAISSTDQIIATEVDATFPNVDVFFPAIDKTTWQEKDRVHHTADERNLYSYDFVTYVRR